MKKYNKDIFFNLVIFLAYTLLSYIKRETVVLVLILTTHILFCAVYAMIELMFDQKKAAIYFILTCLIALIGIGTCFHIPIIFHIRAN